MLIGSRTTGGVADIRVLTGGTGYVSPPQVVIAGGGGTGATAVAVMAGTRVDSVIITNPGTGYTASPTISFSATTGSSAAATAFAYSGPLRPLSFFKGRFGTLYGVDGMGRGVRWPGGSATVAPIGLNKPAVGPAMTASSTSPGKIVSSIQIVEGGRGYASAPNVSISGGTPTRTAVAQAVISNGRVAAVRVTDTGVGYQERPAISFSGGIGTGATFTVGVAGAVSQILITDAGTGYTSSSTGYPTVTVATSNGLTGFVATVVVDTYGRIVGGAILNAGTGATTTPTFSVTAPTGSGAILAASMVYSVQAVTVAGSGSDYFTPPIVTIRADADDPNGFGAELESEVDGVGHVSGVTVVAGGQYSLPPSALIIDTSARAQASVAEPLRGKYKCAIRYLDETAREVGGPLVSSISHLVDLDAGDGLGAAVWSFSHPYVDDRVKEMELWRTSGDQAVLLFRVATIKKTDGNWSGTYVDSMPDAVLTDTARSGYGLMPITLPSGQINARRFEVPPGRMAVATMFQDRAWYAVDTSGQSPNSLYYSEIDEPESVPLANELIVQENTDVPDSVVALVPLGSALLVVQSAHLYRLMYVSQPVLDASMMLMAHRGIINSRCWAVMAGVAFLADTVGVYAFDGNQEQAISAPVDDYWREGKIDFSKSDKFHVDADHLSRTVRFYYCGPSDSEPVRALCYCTATQAWWAESYATAVTASASTVLGQQRKRVLGGADGVWRKETGTQDGSSAVEYLYRTGNLALDNEPDRSIAVLYEPTASAATLNLSLRYNNSALARDNAIQSDRGSGFTVTAGGPASLNMQKTRSALGDATGQAVAHYAGRKSERSAGGDQHISVQVAGTQAADKVTLYGMRVSGAK
jgi:hypothetical protein